MRIGVSNGLLFCGKDSTPASNFRNIPECLMTIVKKLSFAFLLLLARITQAQPDTLQGFWVNKNNQAVYFSGRQADNIISDKKGTGLLLPLYRKDTVLTSLSGRNNALPDRLLYQFTIRLSADKKLLVRPESELAKRLFGSRRPKVFIPQDSLADRTIAFERLIYHSTACFGWCPILDIAIDNSRNVYMKAKVFTPAMATDTLRSGTFAGKLNENKYRELVQLLQTCNLRNLEFPEVIGADAPETTLIIYFNGQQKYLRSMFPPLIAQQLISFLHTLHKNVSLPRTTEVRVLEK